MATHYAEWPLLEIITDAITFMRMLYLIEIKII